MDTELQVVTREKFVADLRAVLADTEQLLKSAVGQSAEKLAALQPRIEENLRNARQRLEEFEQMASARARRHRLPTPTLTSTHGKSPASPACSASRSDC